MSEVFVLFEALKREDGSVYGLGASVECEDKQEAKKLLDSGDYISFDPSLKKESKKKASKDVDAVEELLDGDNR